uniref:WRKY domain-containing protein n=1 Tax=Leersia perrieri TaxID=77586 RepID=A0A0D9XMY2_9ORYZ
MCDNMFWQSAADQGELLDVVRPRHPDISNSPYLLVEAAGGEQQRQIAAASHGDVDGNEQQQQHCEGLLHAVLPPPLQPMIHHDQDRVLEEEPAGGAQAELMFGDHQQQAPPPMKRRRSETRKKVVCIPAATSSAGGGGEVVPSDLWAWRKYGQKPIKGSPYPRGYYRCSSSKGCSARKQVERSRADPTMLVITYTSDHNHPWPTHRNALAGSTRPSAAPPTPPPAITTHHLKHEEEVHQLPHHQLLQYPADHLLFHCPPSFGFFN